MKQRMPIILLSVIGLLTLAGRASAVPIPFQVGGSDLTVISSFAIGGYTYSDRSMAAPLPLDDGDGFTFTFGHVDIPLFAIGTGRVQLAIQLLSPTPDGAFTELGRFVIGAFLNEGAVRLRWGRPVSFDYSYDGGTGGILSLHMRNIRRGFDGGFNIRGKITNVQSPTQVPEPGVLLLLGAGLLTVATLRRRKATQS